MGVEAPHLAQSHRGAQECSSITEDGRPSVEVWDRGNEALGTSGGLWLRQSLETRGGESSFCSDLGSQFGGVEASAGAATEVGFT